MNTTSDTNDRSVLGVAAEAARAAAHIAHETATLKTAAADAIADGLYRARRTASRAERGVEALREDAIYRIRHNPVTAVSAGFAAGVGVGVLLALAALRRPNGHNRAQ